MEAYLGQIPAQMPFRQNLCYTRYQLPDDFSLEKLLENPQMLFERTFFACTVIVFAYGAAVAAPLPLRASADTIYERQYLGSYRGGEVHLVNRTSDPVRLDSLEVRVDRKRYRTLALDFSLTFSTGTERQYNKIFYWSDSTGKSWLSQPVLIPPGDSARVYMLRIDRCPKCNGRPVDVSPASSEIVAPLIFRSKSRPNDSVKVVVRGWYLNP